LTVSAIHKPVLPVSEDPVQSHVILTNYQTLGLTITMIVLSPSSKKHFYFLLWLN